MGLTERHWFEEEDTLNERQLEDEIEYGEARYQAGYKKGYADALASIQLRANFYPCQHCTRYECDKCLYHKMYQQNIYKGDKLK